MGLSVFFNFVRCDAHSAAMGRRIQ
jgi:hypothetical protein